MIVPAYFVVKSIFAIPLHLQQLIAAEQTALVSNEALLPRNNGQNSVYYPRSCPTLPIHFRMFLLLRDVSLDLESLVESFCLDRSSIKISHVTYHYRYQSYHTTAHACTFVETAYDCALCSLHVWRLVSICCFAASSQLRFCIFMSCAPSSL
jgi:hypothetical protein